VTAPVGYAATQQRLFGDFPILAELAKHRPADIAQLVQTVRNYAEFNARHVIPQALAIDRRIERDTDYFPWDLVRAGLPYRMLSMAIPKSVGGVGGLALLSAIGLEELCAACAGVATIFGAHGLGVAPLLVAGAVGHWEGPLREVVEAEKRGRPLLMATAITEPSAGTDVEEPHLLQKARLGMHAKRVDGGYLLNGRKCFISNGSVAKYTVVCTATDRSRPVETFTTFIVDRDMPGFQVGRIEHKMGQRACPAAELEFTDCFVPDDYVVGDVGDGMQPGTLLVLAASRAPVGGIGTGIARGAYEWFSRWAERRHNGHRPADDPRIQMAMAEMLSAIQVSRWAYVNAALAFDNSLGAALNTPLVKSLAYIPRFVRTSRAYKRFCGSPFGKRFIRGMVAKSTTSDAVTQALGHASMAKAVGGDTAMAVTSRALSLMGTAPSEERMWVEKGLRDAKLTQIFEGTNQLNRLTLYETRIAGGLRVELSRATA